jgi:coproporphyrinogen III oxidase
MTATDATLSDLGRPTASGWTAELHEILTGFFQDLEPSATFEEDRWTRPGGGGGWTRVLADGEVFEKAGVNRAEVWGPLDPRLARQLLLDPDEIGTLEFYATGVSIVAHPRNPHVPIVHENVRYFQLSDGSGAVRDHWLGGGLDLTPTYPHPEDARHFHRSVRSVCDRHHPGLYPKYKAVCDGYFVNTHRDGEARGVGGIFFDHLRPEDASGFDAFTFVRDVGRSIMKAYGPMVRARRDTPYADRERALQLWRRGRYVEFNLVHDRGTKFGLESSARIESVLMSLPPLAAWRYDPHFEEGSIEARLMEMLRPRDWTAQADGAD